MEVLQKNTNMTSEAFISLIGLFTILILFRKLLKIKVNPKIEKIVKYLTIIHVFALIIFFVLSKQGLYLRGYKSLTILLISTIFVATLYYLYSVIKGIPRNLFLVVLLLSIVLTALIGFMSFDNYHKNNYFDNPNYRVEQINSILGPYRPPVLFVKNGLFEKKKKLYYQNEPFEPFKNEIDSIKIIKENNNYQVVFYLEKHRIYKTQTKN